MKSWKKISEVSNISDVSEISTWPCVEYGVENVLASEAMAKKLGDGQNSFTAGSSTRN